MLNEKVVIKFSENVFFVLFSAWIERFKVFNNRLAIYSRRGYFLQRKEIAFMKRTN
jgi:hypothetical protein